MTSASHPSWDGYATKTQKAFELNAAGIGTFDGFFFMDGLPGGGGDHRTGQQQ